MVKRIYQSDLHLNTTNSFDTEAPFLDLHFGLFQKVQNGNRSRQDKSDDKQPKWLPKRDQDSQRLEKVENFNYLGAIISNEGSKHEILSRIAQTTAALSRLKIIWRDNNISLASKVKLMWTLILSSFFYACESWAWTAEI